MVCVLDLRHISKVSLPELPRFLGVHGGGEVGLLFCISQRLNNYTHITNKDTQE